MDERLETQWTIAGKPANTQQELHQLKPIMNKPCDGIICFGGIDWWYHNRGHYDPQMMQNLQQHVPVIYINSIGMRAPKASEGKMFVTRILRKLKSLTQGFSRITDNFAVFSAISLPGGGSGPIGKLNSRFLALQARLAARAMGMKNPAVWIACPPAAGCLPYLSAEKVIYQRTDRFESFANINTAQIKGYDRDLKQHADLVLFCSQTLYDAEREECQHAAFVDHGVDYDIFSTAGENHQAQDDPRDVSHIPHPRVGFIGGLDAHTFDPELFVSVAKQLPQIQFILVGASSLPENWCPLGNVHLLGKREYVEVANYMAACDVLIMPWNNSSWIEACNPVKLKEYLAVGRPVVSTYFPELEKYKESVKIERDVTSFAQAISQSISLPGNAQLRRARVANETWSAKAQKVWGLIQN